MTLEEAFERAYWDARSIARPDEQTNWEWLEHSLEEALATGHVVAAGYYAGRLSRRGEAPNDGFGMVYSYEV